MVTHTAEIAVVGAGIVGSSIALALARAGHDVAVLDKAGGLGHGSTSASSGVVRFHYSTYAGVALAWESVHGWRDWAEHLAAPTATAAARFVRTGILVLDHEPGASLRTTELFDRVGVPWQAWDTAAIRRAAPHLDPGRYGPPVDVHSEAFFADADGTLTGTFTPDAGHVPDPQLAAHNLGEAAQQHGARYLLRRQVRGIGPGRRRRWALSTGAGHASEAVEADVVVNAAGPWSSRLNALVGVETDFTVTSRPLRQEVHEVPAPPGFAHAPGEPGIAVADPDLGIYVRSAYDGAVLVGGMEPACDPFEWLEDPDQLEPHPTRQVFDAQVLRAARRFPGLPVPNRPVGIAGVYDATTDWAPIYDRTSLPGFYVAIGTSGNQFKNAPSVGGVMRALIEAVESGHDHDADPVRVALPRTGLELDLAAYSRLRPVDATAPASVLG
jgi:sarcosine oxidase, subunit beta